jgi:hypothetical protein
METGTGKCGGKSVRYREYGLECLGPETGVGGRYCTTEVLKTHKTGLQKVLYAWHPFYGREVLIQGERNRRGALMCICTSEGDGTGAVMEVPIWMFDPAACCHFSSGSSAYVDVPALRALGSVLNRATQADVVIEAHKSTLPGGFDAQTPQRGSDSAAAIPAACSNSASTTGGPFEGGRSYCSDVTPTLNAKRGSSSGGARE